MSPFRVVLTLSLGAAVLFSLTSQGSANVSGLLVTAPKAAPRYCSGAFRYAARLGNAEIAAIAPAQAYSDDRRLTRMLRRTRAHDDVAAEQGPTARTAMCG